MIKAVHPPSPSILTQRIDCSTLLMIPAQSEAHRGATISDKAITRLETVLFITLLWLASGHFNRRHRPPLTTVGSCDYAIGGTRPAWDMLYKNQPHRYKGRA